MRVQGTAASAPYCYVCVQIIENDNEIIIQGYAYQDWIREIPSPQVVTPDSCLKR